MKKGLLLVFIFSFIFCNQALAYDASYVLGQANFSTSGTGLSATTLNEPSAVFYDSTRQWLYVSDNNNNRVVVYDLSDGITSGEAAAYVIGQINPTSNGTSIMSAPEGIYVDTDNQKLTVNSSGDNNVLTFNIEDGIDPGEVAVSTLDSGQIPSNFDSSSDLIIAQGKLFLLDPTHARVLVFETVNGVPVSGSQAVNVLGQANLNDTSAIDPNAGATTTPTGLAYDEDDGLLFVSLGGYAYTRVFDIGDGITDGEPAAYIIGPFSDLTAETPITPNYGGSNVLVKNGYNPEEGRYYSTDVFEPRALIFNIADGITNGEDADSVLGQDAFDTYDSGTSASLVNSFADIEFDPDNNRIFAVDPSNNRVLVYEYVTMTDNASLPDATNGSSYNETLDVEHELGTLDFTVESGAIPTGLALSNLGVFSGVPTTNGVFDFTVKVTDTANAGAHKFSDTKDFSITVNPAASSGGGGSSGSKVRGCTDKQAKNYEANAEVDNGSCSYAVNLPTSSITCPYFVSYAKMGYKQNNSLEVKKIQTFLNEKMSSGLFVDGVFGPRTDKAVRNFQAKYYTEVIAPWTPRNGLTHTTGWWWETTSGWANKLSGC